jgi:branched-chain amino acid transport system substrate-binding protein
MLAFTPTRAGNGHMPRSRIRAFALVAAVSALAAIGGCTRTPDVVKIGVGQPLSGPLAGLGQDMVNGAQLAIDEINANGGFRVGGKKVRLEVVTGDDKANADAGKEVAQRLVEADVVAAIANLNSGVSIAAAPIYAKAGIPQLTISTKTEFTKLGLPTTLRLVANDDLQSKAMGSFASRLPGATGFAVLDDGTPYGKGLADGAANVLVSSGKTVKLRQSLDDKTVEFSRLVDGLRSASVDTVITTLSDFQVQALLKQLAAAGLTNLVIVGGDALKTDKLLRETAPARAIYATSPIVEPREFPNGNAFIAKFRDKFKKEPVYAAHYSYDAVYLISDAMTRNDSVDKAELLKRLKSFDGNCPVTSSMRFGSDGEQRYGAVAIYKLHAGAWEPEMRSSDW